MVTRPNIDIGSSPRILSLRESISDLVKSGAWLPGVPIPSFDDICSLYDTPRVFVSRALRELVKAGVLAHVDGLGIVVADRWGHDHRIRFRNIGDEIRDAGKTHNTQLLMDHKIIDEDKKDKPSCFSDKHKIDYSSFIHRADGIPIQFAEWWVDRKCFPGYRSVNLRETPPEEFFKHTAPSRITDYQLHAVLLDERVRNILAVPAVNAGLLAIANVSLEGKTVALGHLYYPGDRYVLPGRIKL